MKTFIFAVFAMFLLHGCDLFDEEEDIPSFVYVEAADLQTDSDIEGADTHGIIDVHAFAQGEFLGAYELPTNIPIYASGPTQLTLAPGIKNNGLTSNRLIYAFYANNVTEIDLIPGTVTTFPDDGVPTFTYFRGEDGQPNPIRFHIEHFEGQGNVWHTTDTDSIGVVNSSDTAYVRTGSGGGKVVLDEDRPELFVRSSLESWDLSNIPPGGLVYLEIDFKGEAPLEIGVVANQPVPIQSFALGLKATDSWTKVYVDLTDEIHGTAGAGEFQIYLRALKPTGLSQATLALDNVKVIYPK